MSDSQSRDMCHLCKMMLSLPQARAANSMPRYFYMDIYDNDNAI